MVGKKQHPALLLPPPPFFLNESVLQMKNEVSWNEGLLFILSWLPWNVFVSLLPYLWTCWGVARDYGVLVSLPRQRPVGHLRRFWAAPGKGLSLCCLSPDWESNLIYLCFSLGSVGHLGRQRLQEGCVPVTPQGYSPSQHTILMTLWGKAWLPEHQHSPHLDTKGFCFPKPEVGKATLDCSPGMMCTHPECCWLTHSSLCFLTHLHHFSPSLHSLCLLNELPLCPSPSFPYCPSVPPGSVQVVRSPIPWNGTTQVSPEIQPDLHGPLGKWESGETLGMYWRGWAKATVAVPGSSWHSWRKAPFGNCCTSVRLEVLNNIMSNKTLPPRKRQCNSVW